jgi:hypothetical protein
VHNDIIGQKSLILKDAFARLEDSLSVEGNNTTSKSLLSKSTALIFTKSSKFTRPLPSCLSLYLRWYYTTSLKQDGKTAPEDEDLVQVWMLGDVLRCTSVQNAAIQLLLDSKWSGDGPHRRVELYRQTSKGCPLRKLVVDRMVRKLS